MSIFNNVVSALIAGGIMAAVHQAVKLRQELSNLRQDMTLVFMKLGLEPQRQSTRRG